MADARLQQELDESKLDSQNYRADVPSSADSSQKSLAYLACTVVVRFGIDKFPRGIYFNPWRFHTDLPVGRKKDGENRGPKIGRICSSILSRVHRAPNVRRVVETFEVVFRKRYKDVHTNQYRYKRLQMAGQDKNESHRSLQTGVAR